MPAGSKTISDNKKSKDNLRYHIRSVHTNYLADCYRTARSSVI